MNRAERYLRLKVGHNALCRLRGHVERLVVQLIDIVTILCVQGSNTTSRSTLLSLPCKIFRTLSTIIKFYRWSASNQILQNLFHLKTCILVLHQYLRS